MTVMLSFPVCRDAQFIAMEITPYQGESPGNSGLPGIDKKSFIAYACRVGTESRDVRAIPNATASGSVKSPYANAFGFAPALA